MLKNDILQKAEELIHCDIRIALDFMGNTMIE